MITVCIIAALLGMALLTLHINSVMDAAAIALVEFASGPIFPSMIATTPARVGLRHTANAVGLQLSIAAVGFAALPAVCGLIGQHAGLEFIPILTACWVALLAAYLMLQRR